MAGRGNRHRAKIISRQEEEDDETSEDDDESGTLYSRPSAPTGYTSAQDNATSIIARVQTELQRLGIPSRVVLQCP